MWPRWEGVALPNRASLEGKGHWKEMQIFDFAWPHASPKESKVFNENRQILMSDFLSTNQILIFEESKSLFISFSLNIQGSEMLKGETKW